MVCKSAADDYARESLDCQQQKVGIVDCIEEGIVTRVMGPEAEVTAALAEAGASCDSKSACSALGGVSSHTIVRVGNPIGARLGDRVTVTLPGNSVVSAAGLLYFFPAVALIAGAVAGNALATRTGTNVDLGSFFGAIAALLVSFVVVTVVGRRLGKRKAFVPQIARVVAEGELSGE